MADSEEVLEFDTAFDGEFDRLTDRQVAAVVALRAALQRVEAERDLALRALGFGTYEAAARHIRMNLSGPAPAGWPYGLNTPSAGGERADG